MSLGFLRDGTPCGGRGGTGGALLDGAVCVCPGWTPLRVSTALVIESQ